MTTSEPTGGGHDGSTTPDSQHKRTGQRQPLVIQPPLAVPLDDEHERAAIDTLAELLATWREHHHGGSGTEEVRRADAATPYSNADRVR